MKKTFKIIGIIFAVLIIVPVTIAIIFGDTDYQAPAQMAEEEEVVEPVDVVSAPEPEQSKQPEVTKPAPEPVKISFQDQIRTNLKGKDFQPATIELAADGTLSVSAHAKSIYSSNTVWRGTAEVLEAITTAVAQSPEVKKLSLVMTSDGFTNSYGEDLTNVPVAKLTMSRASWERIVWKNFIRKNLPTVTDTFWIHPSFAD